MSNSDYTFYRQTPHGLQENGPITLSSRLIIEEAERWGMTWQTFPGTKIIELTLGSHREYFRYQIPSVTTAVGFYACLDKAVTHNLLSEQGLSVPNGYRIDRTDTPAYWQEVYEALTKPLVVKPTHGNKGSAVSLEIYDYETFAQAVARSFEYLSEEDAGVMVEETFVGSEYRILTTQEKVLGIVNRVPANVMGDGISTLQMLVEEKNNDPRRGVDDRHALYKIAFDQDVLSNMAEQNLLMDSVIPLHRQIFLRKVSNVSKGGDSIDVTDIADETVFNLAKQVLAALPGLSLAGVDFMTSDISKPQSIESYVIIEVNSSASLDLHELPYIGESKNVKLAFLELMFKEIKNQK